MLRKTEVHAEIPRFRSKFDKMGISIQWQHHQLFIKALSWIINRAH